MVRALPTRILVVDDNHLIRRLLDLILEDAGYEPLGAESGEEALALALVDPPDLCIVDEVMPGMRGSELILLLRASPEPRLARMPIVGVSGHEGASGELLRAGADSFVRKPLEERAVLAAVARAFGASRDPRHPPSPGAA